MGSRHDADFTMGRPAHGPRPEPLEEGPSHLLLVGDFSGRTERDAPLASRPFVRLDPDRFDGALARVGARVGLISPDLADSPPTPVDVASMEALHPDGLFPALASLQALDRLRDRLRDPALFASAAAELKAGAGRPAVPRAAAEGPESTEGMLERLLGRTAREGTAPPAEIGAFLRRVVAPHIVASPDPQQAEMIASIEQAMGDQMRAVLRQPPLRRLEAAWRAARWLLDEVGGDEERIVLWILDVGGDEMRQQVAALTERLEREGPPRGERWSLLVCDTTIDASEADLAFLAALGASASRLGAPLLAAASPLLAGAASAEGLADPASWRPLPDAVAAAWRRLRSSPASRHLGLSLPGFLLRLPYGRKLDPIERFAFEEMEPEAGPGELLWGNPAYLCARLAAGDWLEEEPSGPLEVSGLPAWSYTRQGETVMAPCAQAALPERAAEALMDAGFMPLIAPRNRPSVRLARLQSIADPPAPLAGL